MTNRLLVLLPIVLAAGCTVGKDYQQPQLKTDSSYGSALTGAGAATRPASTQPACSDAWWKTLHDPILNDLVARATKGSLDLKIAAARVAEARAYREVVGADGLPQLGVNAGYQHQRFSKTAVPYNSFGSAPNFPWASDAYGTGFNASWEMDVFGGARRAVEAADADVDATVDAQRGAIMIVLAEVSRAYLELRGFQRALEIAQANLQLQEQTLTLTRDRRAHGVVTELDVSRAVAQVANTRATLPLLQTLQWQTIHRLSVLLDEPVEPLADQLIAHKPIPVPPDQVPVGIPSELMRRRPDIRRAERQVAAASARIGVAKADLYPKFALDGNFGLLSAQPQDVARRDSRTYSFGPTVSWPILDGGRFKAMVKVRESEQEQSVFAYEKTVRQAVSEVRDALVAFTQEHQRRQALRDAEQASADAVEMARQLYEKGLTDFLTVLEAQRNLYATQEALTHSELAESTTLVSLYLALGGGWESFVPEKPATQPTTQPDKQLASSKR